MTDEQATRARQAWVGVAALSAALAAVMVLGWSVWGVIDALMARAPATERAAGALEPVEQAGWDQDVAQLLGRSLFFVPAPPPPERVAASAPATPAAPTHYGGPRLIAMIHDQAWFEDGRRLTVGGPPDGELELLQLDAPWAATVRWRGVEFQVELFQRDQTVLGDRPTPDDAAAIWSFTESSP